MSKPSRFPLVRNFCEAFRNLAPGESEAVIEEMENLCQGYRIGKAEAEDEMFAACDGEEVLLSETSGGTLAEMLNAAQCRPYFVNRGRA